MKIRRDKQQLLWALLFFLIVFSPAIYYGCKSYKEKSLLETSDCNIAFGYVTKIIPCKHNIDFYVYASYQLNGIDYEVDNNAIFSDPVPINSPILVEYVKDKPEVSRIFLRDTTLIYGARQFIYSQDPRKSFSRKKTYSCRIVNAEEY